MLDFMLRSTWQHTGSSGLVLVEATDSVRREGPKIKELVNESLNTQNRSSIDDSLIIKFDGKVFVPFYLQSSLQTNDTSLTSKCGSVSHLTALLPSLRRAVSWPLHSVSPSAVSFDTVVQCG